MQDCIYCRKILLVRMIIYSLKIKSVEIQKHCHLSKSVVSRYINGERDCPEIDIFLIEKFFGIKIKEYSFNEQR